jgi:hypothetical protein
MYVGFREEMMLSEAVVPSHGPTRHIPGFGQSGFQTSFTSDKLIQHFTLGLYRASTESMTLNCNNTQAIVEGFTSTLCGKGLGRSRKEHEGWHLRVTSSFVSVNVSNINGYART